MTDQYAQDGINLQPSKNISVQTDGVTPLDVPLGKLTEDGQSLSLITIGGGSNPNAMVANNYTITNAVTFVREGGVVTPVSDMLSILQVGGPVVVANIAVGDDCIVRITGPAGVYNHRMLAFILNF